MSGGAGSSQAGMHGPNQSDARSCIHVRAYLAKRLVPFMGEQGCEATEEGLGLPSNQTVGRTHEGCEVAATLEARLEVLPLFLLLGHGVCENLF